MKKTVGSIAFSILVLGVLLGSALFLVGLFSWDTLVRIMHP